MSLMERLLWLTITLLLSTIAALMAGILSRVVDNSLVSAIVSGAVTFAGSETLLLAILGFVFAKSTQK